ncbi:2-nitropropane dioxygenase [Leucosporidium creatinivorum]|uniref:2-nitropropane dioxygenase n=1 Tax=Leucosporidium creatinivorum TaxID=106004 RepID=A0A1Y2G485_9BASI|nr:2-nitropropane dioxygenase [Leucosporidium creatinivorum]
MQTALSRLLGIRIPVISAPMAGAAGGALAAAVTRGGGFGFVAAGASPLPSLLKELDTGRKELDLASNDPLPFGIGLMCWRLEAPHGDPSQADAFLSAMVAAKPKAVWMSFGQELQSWVQRYREREAQEGLSKTIMFVKACTAKQALEAKGWEGVDVVVAQGIEAGGHAPTHDVGLPIISLIGTLGPHFPSSSKPLLVAAGGIATGSQLVATLALGAQGVVIGTRFLATKEALYSQAQKDLILRSSGEDTTKGMKWDEARATLGWGEGVDGRGLRNKTSHPDHEAGSEEGKKLYAEAMKEGDVDRIVTWSGTSVGLVKQVQSPAEILTELEKEALASLDRLKQVAA